MIFNHKSLTKCVEFKNPCSVNLDGNRVIFAFGKSICRATSHLDRRKQQHIVLHDVL